MPGRYLTQEEMWRICRAAAEKAAAVHGIKDIDGFTQALMQVSWAESAGPTAEDGWYTWDSQSVHDQGQGFGLFALHDRGYAADLSKEQRLDPQQNADAAAMKLATVWRDGATLEDNVTRMTGPQGQNPADPQALYRNAMSARNQVERESMGAYEAGGQATTGQTVEFAQWLLDHGFGGYVYKAEDGTLMIHTNPPASVVNAFLEDTGGAGAAVPAWEREATEAGAAVNRAQAQEIIARLGGDRYEDERNRILDKIDQENWTAEHAISEFNAWMSGALEAGKRAETVYGEEMKRKVWTTPGEYYPGTEPGGPREQWTEKYGVPYTPSPGIAVETLPNLEQMYGQWHQNMGISQQAPPTQGGWSGQGMGQGAPAGGMQGGAPMGGQGKGYDAAIAFLDQLRQRYAPQFGAARA